MMASLSAGSNFNNVDNNSNSNNNGEENDYEEDSFDEDSEDEDEEEEGGRALSETGTYVLDKEEEEKQKVKMMTIKLMASMNDGRGSCGGYREEIMWKHIWVVGGKQSDKEVNHMHWNRKCSIFYFQLSF